MLHFDIIRANVHIFGKHSVDKIKYYLLALNCAFLALSNV